MIQVISTLIIHLIQSIGYLGVFLLMTLEAALIPIPSEITLPFAGFLAQKGTFILPLVMLAGIAGDVLGTMILYALGYFLEENFILKLLDTYGKFILISRDEYNTVMKWFQKKGSIIIIVCKLLPGFRTIIGLFAGISEVFCKSIWIYYLGVSYLVWESYVRWVCSRYQVEYFRTSF